VKEFDTLNRMVCPICRRMVVKSALYNRTRKDREGTIEVCDEGHEING